MESKSHFLALTTTLPLFAAALGCGDEYEGDMVADEAIELETSASGLGGRCMRRLAVSPMDPCYGNPYIIRTRLTYDSRGRPSNSRAGTKVLDIPNGWATDQGPVNEYEYHGGPNQQWVFEPTSVTYNLPWGQPPLTKTVWRIRNVMTNCLLGTETAITGRTGRLIQFCNWTDALGGVFPFPSVNWVVAPYNAPQSTNPGRGTSLTRISLRPVHPWSRSAPIDNCLDIPSGLLWDGLYLQTYACHHGPYNQTWDLVSAD